MTWNVAQHITLFLQARKRLLYFLVCFFLINTCLFWLIGSNYLYIMLSSKTFFSNSFQSYDTLAGKAFVLFFTLVTYLGHFTLLAFMPFFIISLPIVLLSRHRLLVIGSAVLAGTFSLIALATDSIVYSLYHFHLNPTLLKMIFGEKYGVLAFLELSSHEVFTIVTACGVLLLLEVVIAIFIWKQIVVKNRLRFAPYLAASLFGCLYLSYLILIYSMLHDNNVFAQQTPNLPLYNNFFSKVFPFKDSLFTVDFFSETRFSQPLFSTAPLHYPLHPMICKPPKKPLNIIMIGIDTWRMDALNSALTPHIARFSQKAWRFNQHFSGGNSTQPGLFALFYGLPGNYWSSMLKQKQGALLIHELIKQHYQTEIIFSSDMVPPFNDTIFSELKNIRTMRLPGNNVQERDRTATEKFNEFINKQSKDSPFFVFLLYDAAHAYCDQQTISQLYPIQSECKRILLASQKDKENIVKRYQNALHFIDGEIARVLKTVKEKGLLDNTVIIVTGDHGEEFDDNKLNYWGHGSNYTPIQLQTPLIIYWPQKKPATLSHQTSHYDIPPFLMKKVLGCQNPEADYSIGKPLLSAQNRPYLIVGSYINMGILENHVNTTLLTSGDIQIADQHANLLPSAKPNLTTLAAVLADMRRFYR